MSDTWTGEQRDAIFTRARRALVSASAGTGKTTVLVARYLWLITRDEDRVLPGDILAVTFTEAAATEMRKRVREGLARWASGQPDPSAWRRQIAGIERAPISTIHAFCNRLLRQQYQALDIDPGYDILDEDEGKLLMSEIADRVIDESFEIAGEEGEAFRRLASRAGGHGAAAVLRDFALECARFLESIAEPEEWMDRALSGYRMAAAGVSFDHLPWVPRFLSGARDSLEQARDLNDAARRHAGRDPGLAPWIPELDRRIALCGDWADRMRPGENLGALAREMLAAFEDMRPSKATDEAAKKSAQHAYKRACEIVTGMAKTRLGAGAEAMVALLADVCPDAAALMALVRRFRARFREEKRARGVLDFADLERETDDLLRLAASGGGHIVVPSFRHVLVDEFQDVNRLQDDIIKRLAPEGSLFLVGDVKQCIYRFRQAEPRVLVEKSDEFRALTNYVGKSFPLTRNFRANGSVIAGVNALFGPAMSRRLGGVAYDEEHALRVGDESRQIAPAGPGPAVELHVLNRIGPGPSDDPDAADSWEAVEREAFALGSRIRDLLLGEGPESMVRDPDSNEPRHVEAGDIVVLLRAGKGRADLFESVFRRLGLTASASPAGSLLEPLEVRQIVSILRMLENPLWDVPLAAALLSPAFGFDVDEIVVVRVASRRVALFESLVAHAGSDDASGRKVKDALARIDRWRTEARRRSLPDLIALLLEETRLPHYCLGRPDGEARRDALFGLFDLAREFERRHLAGLSRFVDFLEQLAHEEIEPESPVRSTVGRAAIRIQTIHQSKGLEYPVVAVACLGTGWNLTDRAQAIGLAREAGIGLRWVDPMRIARRPTMARDAVDDEIREETLSEEMRLLYVASTRARDRLLLSGTAMPDRLIEACSSAAEAGSARLPEYRMTAAGCSLEWVAPVIALHPEGAPLRGDGPRPAPSSGRGEAGLFSVTLYDEAAIRTWRAGGDRTREDQPLLARAAALEDLGPVSAGRDLPSLIARATWVYPGAMNTRRVAKASVSELKRRFDVAPTADPTDAAGPALFDHPSDSFRRAPSFTSEGTRAVGALSRGRAMHAVLERIDLSGPLDAADVRGVVERLVREEVLDEASAGLVEPERIAGLFSGPLGARIRRDPSRVRREVPINIAVSPEAWERWMAGEWVEPDRGGGEFVHVQGIVDCVVLEEDGLLLVDYKTDRVRGEDVDRRQAFYRPQIVAYAAALGVLFGGAPREAVLYFLEPGEVRHVDLPW